MNQERTQHAATAQPMSAEEKATFTKLIVLEQLCMLIGMYFILCGTAPEVTADLGLPLLVSGTDAIMTGVAVLVVGVIPLIRFLLSRKKTLSHSKTRTTTEA